MPTYKQRPAVFVNPSAIFTRTFHMTLAPEVGAAAVAGTYNPPGIESGEEFGDVMFTPAFMPAGIASAEAIGTHLYAGGGRVAFLYGIDTEEAFENPTFRIPFHPESIESEEAFGVVSFKSRPEPFQMVVVLVGGPYDGTSVIVGQPWPRHTIVMEDPDTGVFYTYFIEVQAEDDHEPYMASYSAATSESPDSPPEDYLGVGEKGDRGEQGEEGPQGAPGIDGLSFEVTVPTPTAGMITAGWAVSADGDWLQAPSSFNNGSHEPFGMRIEGNYLVFKGVIDWSTGRTISVPIVRPATTFGWAGADAEDDRLDLPRAQLRLHGGWRRLRDAALHSRGGEHHRGRLGERALRAAAPAADAAMTDITFTDGPLDGDTLTVGQPWPRETYLYEDVDGSLATYERDRDDTTEPYTFVLREVTDYEDVDLEADPWAEIPETQETVDPTGMQGEQGVVGEPGPPGEPGVDGVNFEFWVAPKWASALAQGPNWMSESGRYPYPLWRPDGWPGDMRPGTRYEIPNEPGAEHFFDAQEIETLNRQRHLASIGQTDRDDFPWLAVPPGYYSPSRNRRIWWEDWTPIYGFVSHVQPVSQWSSDPVDVFGYTTEGGHNPHFRLDIPHVMLGWMFRGLGARVQVQGWGWLADDPKDLFTRESIYHPGVDIGSITDPPGWAWEFWTYKPGRTNSGSPDFTGYVGRMQNVYCARLAQVFRPKFDHYFKANAWTPHIFSLGPKHFHGDVVFKVGTDGRITLIDSGPTYGHPVLEAWCYEFFTEWEVQDRDFVIT